MSGPHNLLCGRRRRRMIFAGPEMQKQIFSNLNSINKYPVASPPRHHRCLGPPTFMWGGTGKAEGLPVAISRASSKTCPPAAGELSPCHPEKTLSLPSLTTTPLPASERAGRHRVNKRHLKSLLQNSSSSFHAMVGGAFLPRVLCPTRMSGLPLQNRMMNFAGSKITEWGVLRCYLKNTGAFVNRAVSPEFKDPGE